MFNKLISFWTEIKIYLARANSYLIIMNSGALMFLLLDKLKAYGVNINIQLYGILICILGFSALIFIGWLDSKLGLFEQESKRASDRNPYATETLKNTKLILEKLNQHEP